MSTVDRTCEQCGVVFQALSRNVARGWGKFCSRPCKYAAAPARPLAARFESMVVRSEGCWRWSGAHSVGRPTITSGGGGKNSRPLFASRVSWELVNGPIPPGMFVCHRCDNPGCVNPGHLFLGTHQDNMDDMKAKGRQPRGEKFPHAKLTEATVRAIRERAASGTTQARLAEELGVATSIISRVVTRRIWKHVE